MRRLLLLQLTLALGIVREAPTQHYRLLRAIHLPDANLTQAPGQVLFSPNGKLYFAYRLPQNGRTSTTVRVILLNPVTGQQEGLNDYRVSSTSLPRIPTGFLLSEDGKILAYAELHTPQVVLTIEASTLKPVSLLTDEIFGEADSGPGVSTVNSQLIVLTSTRVAKSGRVTTTELIRKLSLDVTDLHRVVSDKTFPPDTEKEGLLYWAEHTHPKHDLSAVLPFGDYALGLTNLMTEGWIRLFDRTGGELASAHNPDCGYVRGSLSQDQQVGVAVCETTSLEEAHFGETVRREAVVFEVKTLKTIATIPMPRISVKESGPHRGDLWVARLSPAIWRGMDGLLVAVPNPPDSIGVYSIARVDQP